MSCEQKLDNIKSSQDATKNSVDALKSELANTNSKLDKQIRILNFICLNLLGKEIS
jgi:hypothetical protein